MNAFGRMTADANSLATYLSTRLDGGAEFSTSAFWGDAVGAVHAHAELHLRIQQALLQRQRMTGRPEST